VFHSDRTGRNQIYVWSDGVVRRLAHTAFDDRSASGSPDGRQIAFVSIRDAGDDGTHGIERSGSAPAAALTPG
jgi:Tol biopolymer transport system component